MWSELGKMTDGWRTWLPVWKCHHRARGQYHAEDLYLQCGQSLGDPVWPTPPTRSAWNPFRCLIWEGLLLSTIKLRENVWIQLPPGLFDSSGRPWDRSSYLPSGPSSWESDQLIRSSTAWGLEGHFHVLSAFCNPPGCGVRPFVSPLCSRSNEIDLYAAFWAHAYPRISCSLGLFKYGLKTKKVNAAALHLKLHGYARTSQTSSF